MRRVLLAALLLANIAMVRPAIAQDRVKLFGGYSFANVPFTVFNPGQSPSLPTLIVCLEACPINATITQMGANASGWEISGSVRVYKWIGAVADFDGHYSSFSGTPIHRHSSLFGPEVALPGRVSPFVHVLIGGASESVGFESANAFASAFGGGIDLKAAPHISIRLIQVDYFMTHFGNFSQNKYRFSTGIVLRF